MRMILIPSVAIAALGGCFSLRADIPPDAVRLHMAREEGIELGAICSHEGRSFSEGAVVCMSGQRMTCGATARWEEDGACPAEEASTVSTAAVSERSP